MFSWVLPAYDASDSEQEAVERKLSRVWHLLRTFQTSMVQAVFLGGSRSLRSACAVSWVWSMLFPSFHSVSPHRESSVGLSLIHTCCSYGSHLFCLSSLNPLLENKQANKNKNQNETNKKTSPGFIQKMYINQSVCEFLKGFVCTATAVLLKP